MSFAAEISAMRERAETALQAITEENIDDEALLDRAQLIRTHADKLSELANEPITIGVVGGYNAGKSLLLGSLLGLPALLPVENRATTGNVTRISLRQAAPDRPSRLRAINVSYLTEVQLRECIQYMLQGLVDDLRSSTGRIDPTPLVDYDPLADGWRTFELWARPVLELPDPLIHRNAIAELLRIRDASTVGRAFLGEALPVDEKTASAALDLGVPAELPHTIPPVPPGAGLTPRRTLDVPTLRATFPLVRRMNYEVEVDADSWELTALSGEDETVLLDFPGLDAATSFRRDRFLGMRELADVTSILVAIDTSRPQSNIVNEFLAMLDQHHRTANIRDGVLAVLTRFDLLLPPGEADLPLPARGAGLTSADLLAASGELATAWHSVGKLVPAHRTDRIALSSAVAAIASRRQPLDGLSDADQARFADALPAAKQRAQQWSTLAARARRQEPGDRLPALLGGFAADGGTSHLRELIERHVAEHGATLRADRMAIEDRALRAEMAGLCRALRARRGVDPTDPGGR